MSTEHEQDDTINMHVAGEQAASGSSDTAASSDGKENATEDSQLAALNERVRELEEENSSLKDQYLRKQADFENFRKRMFREKEESIKYANSQLLLDLILIIDDFERAIKSSEDARDYNSFHEGVTLIEKQFVNMLERKWGLKRFESTGEEFDPQKHEAISMESREDHDTSMVLEDYQRGYFLNDRVLRPAKVKVSMPAVQSNDRDKEDSTDGNEPKE